MEEFRKTLMKNKEYKTKAFARQRAPSRGLSIYENAEHIVDGLDGVEDVDEEEYEQYEPLLAGLKDYQQSAAF